MRVTKQVRDWQEDMKMCEKASPEPWRVEQLEYMGNRGMIQETVIDGVTSEIYNEEDARFISEARQALPYWLQQYAVWKVKAHEAEFREKKLREAIEEALSWTWDCAEGNMLEVSSILHSSLYPEEGTPQVKPLNNEDMQASQAFINRAMKEEEAK